MYVTYVEQEEKVGVVNKITKLMAVFFGFQAILLAFLTTLFYFLQEGLETDHVKGSITYISDNINTLPIQQIYLQENGCSENLEKIDIYTYRGTKSGCICGSKIRSNNCDSCTNISSTYHQELFSWRDKNICVQRVTKFRKTTEDCPTNYIRCNPQLCILSVDQNSVCPVTEIKIVAKTAVDYENYKNVASEEIEYNSEYALFIWRSVGEQGVYTLSAHLDNDPCLDERKDPPLMAGNEKYPLSKGDHDCGDNGQDSKRSELIDTLDYTGFLESNGMQREIQSLPRFDEYALNLQLLLFSRSQVEFQSDKDGCDNFEVEQFNKLDDIEGNIDGIGLLYFILKFVFGSGLVFSYMLECCKHKGRFQKFIPGISHMLMFFNMILLLILLMEGSYIYYYYGEKQEILEYYQNLGKKECFGDTNLNIFFKDIKEFYSQSLQDYDSMTYVAFWWSGILTLVMIVLHSLQACTGCRQTWVNKKGKKYGQGYNPMVSHPYQPYKSVDQQNQQTEMQNINPYSIHQNPYQTPLQQQNQQQLLLSQSKNPQQIQQQQMQQTQLNNLQLQQQLLNSSNQQQQENYAKNLYLQQQQLNNSNSGPQHTYNFNQDQISDLQQQNQQILVNSRDQNIQNSVQNKKKNKKLQKSRNQKIQNNSNHFESQNESDDYDNQPVFKDTQ